MSADSVRGISGETSCNGIGSRVSCAASVSRGDGPERRDAGHQLVGEKADCVDVDAMVGRDVAGELLGRHIRRRANGDTGRREAGRRQRSADGFCDAEVGDERVGSLREDVRRLDVAMDDAALVCECERVDDVMQNPHNLARAELSFSLEGGAK